MTATVKPIRAVVAKKPVVKTKKAPIARGSTTVTAAPKKPVAKKPPTRPASSKPKGVTAAKSPAKASTAGANAKSGAAGGKTKRPAWDVKGRLQVSLQWCSYLLSRLDYWTDHFKGKVNPGLQRNPSCLLPLFLVVSVIMFLFYTVYCLARMLKLSAMNLGRLSVLSPRRWSWCGSAWTLSNLRTASRRLLSK